MSKNEKVPSTPEARAEKLANKQMLKRVFSKTFLKAFSICLAILLVFSVGYIAFVNPNSIQLNTLEPGNLTAQGAVSQNPDGSGGNASDGSAAAQLPTVTELTASSSQEEILSYFNTAINKIKPSAKSVILKKEVNSQAGGISGNLPSSLTGLADSLISSNMGEKDVTAVSPATSESDKNAMFPVENESWSSKLQVEDISNATVAVSDTTYTITVLVKEDAPSTTTAHGTGHHGKAFSVIMPSIIMDNAGPASGIMKNVQTGHNDGKIAITVDKATGNVTSATYYFVWTLSLEALGVQISIPFGLEKEFAIEW